MTTKHRDELLAAAKAVEWAENELKRLAQEIAADEGDEHAENFISFALDDLQSVRENLEVALYKESDGTETRLQEELI